MHTGHTELYRKAEYYDIAFSFRDVKKECDFLEYVYEKNGGGKLESFLEICAGPAVHTLEMARRGKKACGLDFSREMVDYGKNQAKKLGLKMEYIQGNMEDFSTDQTFDMAAILMDSTSYLLTNEAVYSHFQCVASALNKSGIYLLEMGHPRDFFSVGKSAVTEWEMEREGIKVHFSWGHEDDFFDPISQITNTTVSMKVRKKDEEIHVLEKAPQRCFGPNEFMALVKADGCFKIDEIMEPWIGTFHSATMQKPGEW